MHSSSNSLALSDCITGQVAQIIYLTGDLETKLRLVHLGFHTHSIVELVLSRGANVVVSVDGSRFALDRSIAQFIQVEPLS